MNSGTQSNLFQINKGNNSYSTTSGGEYEVFLSFSGRDTRKGFTDFLYTYLTDANIRTFRDDDKLHVGEDIGLELLKAIKESKISIPIFSKSYASSKWCLRELAYMVECHLQEGQMIYPIFYDVKPYEVRYQTGCYKEAFYLHEKNFDETTVQEWKEAMEKVGKLKGLELMKECNGHEGQLVKKVVRDVLSVLKKNYVYADDNLVGMDGHVEAMNKLLDLNDSNGIRVVGIHGMGGLGKTTIAKVVYHKMSAQFKNCCFLEDVRANSVGWKGIVDLQKQLLCKINKGGNSRIYSADEGIAKIKETIRTKKLLIVLDDLDDIYQWNNLVGQFDLFGAGSRILVTTRNKEVLDTLEAICQTENLHNAYRSYEPRLMEYKNSLTLFSRHAFMRDSPPSNYLNLAWKVVSSAGGLPLVLVTIGSLLFGKKDMSLWEEKLRKLKEIPHEKVLERLRISYDALEYTQRQIFLDTACLFIGYDCVNPCYMWEACGFHPSDGLNALVLRHMVQIDDDNELRMHDHLRDLGRQIVREENMSEQGERSRLWSSEDALDLLERRKLTTKIQALNLELEKRLVDRIPRLVGDDFAQLRNLRFLNLGCADLDGDFKEHLSNLRWLEWKCPANFWPENCYLKNLMILDLRNSDMTDDWKGWSEIKMAKNLEVLNLSRCCKLKKGPVFSKITTYQALCLRVSWSWKESDPSKWYLTNLRVLDISYCEELQTFDCSPFAALQEMNLCSCTSLRILVCIKQLKSLRYINLNGCESLIKLPDLSNFKKLEKLQLSDCSKLVKIQGLDMLQYFEHLEMSSYADVLDIPKSSGHEYAESLPSFLNLRVLGISNSEKLKTFDCSRFSALEDLNLSGCTSLHILVCFDQLQSIRYTNMNYCARLRKLLLRDCDELTEIQGLNMLESLEYLDMTSCEGIEKLPSLSNLKMLKQLCLRYCKNLVEVEGVESLESLEDLDMYGCESVERLPDLSNLGVLRKLCLHGCKNLREVKGLRVLKSSGRLDSYCTSLDILLLELDM